VSEAHDSLAELRQSLAGAVLTPADAEYDDARRCFNALVDRRPAVVARCLGPGDVATSLDFARAEGLEVAVRGGGHNPAGHCVLDGGLVVDLSLMRGVDVDAGAGIARAQGGSTWLDFDAATQAHGLVTPGGVVGSTGVCGLALGGGIGHLTSQRGLTCDSIVGAELVTPGRGVVRVTEDENADLLWALRGGGGNFGVATSLTFRLYALERVVGGRLTFRGSGVRGALLAFRDLASSSPRELSIQAVLEAGESGAPALLLAPCHTGRGAEQDLRALRSLPGVAEDSLRPQSFLEQQAVFGGPYGVDRHYWKGHFVRELPDELVDVLLERVAALGRSRSQILVESLHGAPKDPAPESAAVGFRHAAFNVSAMAVWTEAAEDDRHVQWARDTASALEPWSVSGGYVNYMQADEPLERLRAAFGHESFDRLRALKARYDPENVLRRNQNIPPLDAGR
jgi:FAD/FMN-containing dehydrogenase